MKKITVYGGKPLVGEITVSGSKNAALPIIFACILTKGTSVLKNIPDIGDVNVALSILKHFGAEIIRSNDTLYINTSRLIYKEPPQDQTGKIRASTYLIGSCLSRFGICHILPFGGCNFSERPIDMHLFACERLGAKLSFDKVEASSLHGSVIAFDKPSVGATVNAILLSASAEGDSVISGCAVEPHIDSLIEFLNSAGADITRQGRDIYVSGRSLHGGNITIEGDMIEAGSYLAAGLITNGRVGVLGCDPQHISSVLDAFCRLGADISFSDNRIFASMGKAYSYCEIEATAYPGFPTDLQPIFAPLLAGFSGGQIVDNVWQSRFGYLDRLSQFGVSFRVFGNVAKIEKSGLHSASISAPDLRGGAACLLAALASQGKSEILSADIILRGYERPEEKLSHLGASILVEQ